MTTTFSDTTRNTLTRCEWQVLTASAHRRIARDGVSFFATVRAPGEWSVSIKKATLAQGQESHPCLAAMDANEILWAWRDGRKVPDHLRGKLTEAGRAVL